MEEMDACGFRRWVTALKSTMPSIWERSMPIIGTGGTGGGSICGRCSFESVCDFFRPRKMLVTPPVLPVLPRSTEAVDIVVVVGEGGSSGEGRRSSEPMRLGIGGGGFDFVRTRGIMACSRFFVERDLRISRCGGMANSVAVDALEC
jgi:hypothetical protein